MVCRFNSSGGADTVSAGAQLTFNTVAIRGGDKYALVNAEYGNCFSVTFDICKNVDTPSNGIISVSEMSKLMKWLTRKDFHQLTLIDKYDTGYNSIHYDGSFSASKVQVGGAPVGLQLVFTSNRPFGYGDAVTKLITIAQNNGSQSIQVDSDQVGVLYPDQVEITLGASGNLTISNNKDEQKMYFANCVQGQVITIDCVHKIVSSSLESHKLYNDFNFVFFRLVNCADNSDNVIQASIPCSIKIKYSPVKKVVI